MRNPERMMPPGGGTRKTLAGGTFNPNNTTPQGFWRGFNGTESIAPPIHRKPPKPRNTFWNPPNGKGGAR